MRFRGTGDQIYIQKMFSAFKKGEVYKDHFEPGVYVCAKCGYELFSRFASRIQNFTSLCYIRRINLVRTVNDEQSKSARHNLFILEKMKQIFSFFSF